MDKLKKGNPTPTDRIIARLRLMASAGGMLTRDRLLLIMEAADRLEDYDERIAIMSEPSIGEVESNEKY